MKLMKIAMVGAGGWGTALARLLVNNGHTVTMWSWQADHVAEMQAEAENRQFLPGVPLPAALRLTNDLSEIRGCEMVVFAVPSAASADVARKALPFVESGSVIVNVAKGFVPQTRQRISEVLCALYPGHAVLALSGPSHAEEVARDRPTAVCVAGNNADACKLAQDVFISPCFRVYTNDDIIGVEIGGAVKNIIAMGSGIVDGLELGDNAKAALMTRGLAEMKRLGCAMGANAATFAGLTGVGDLIVTCTSLHSRNYRAGREIGRGKLWRQVVAETNMVVEGVYATEHAYALAQRYQVEMPITEQMYRILYQDRSPRDAILTLMTRERTEED